MVRRKLCCFCKQPIDGEFGNNAEPIRPGVCCNKCNAEIVIPLRMTEFQIRTGLVQPADILPTLAGEPIK